jgi:hypothetical protein
MAEKGWLLKPLKEYSGEVFYSRLSKWLHCAGLYPDNKLIGNSEFKERVWNCLQCRCVFFLGLNDEYYHTSVRGKTTFISRYLAVASSNETTDCQGPRENFASPAKCFCHDLPRYIGYDCSTFSWTLPSSAKEGPYSDLYWVSGYPIGQTEVKCECGDEALAYLNLPREDEGSYLAPRGYDGEFYINQEDIKTHWFCKDCLGIEGDVDMLASLWLKDEDTASLQGYQLPEPKSLKAIREKVEVSIALGWRPKGFKAKTTTY